MIDFLLQMVHVPLWTLYATLTLNVLTVAVLLITRRNP